LVVNPKLVAKIEAEEPTKRLAVLIDADNAQAVDSTISSSEQISKKKNTATTQDTSEPISEVNKEFPSEFFRQALEQASDDRVKDFKTDIGRV
jgi:hypothetical protein